MRLLIAIALSCAISSCCFYAQCDGPNGLSCSGPMEKFLERDLLLFDTSTQSGFKIDSIKFLILNKSIDKVHWTDTEWVATFQTVEGFPCLRYKIDLNTYNYLRISLYNGSKSWLLSNFESHLEEGKVPKGDCCPECVTKFYSLKLDSVFYSQEQLPILIHH